MFRLLHLPHSSGEWTKGGRRREEGGCNLISGFVIPVARFPIKKVRNVSVSS